MENRSGRIVQGDLTQADGHAERRAAPDMIHRHSPGPARQLTPGADKGFDAAAFVADLRQACVTPHVAQKSRYSAIDGRTTRHEGYAKSQRNRKRIDLRRHNDPPDRCLILLTFGWAKTVGGMAQTVYRGLERVRSRFIPGHARQQPRSTTQTSDHMTAASRPRHIYHPRRKARR